MPKKASKSIQFISPDCTLTLAQGLDEFYAVNAKRFSKPEPNTQWTEMLLAHDACHVFFGLNTSLVEETYADVWTICGTTMTFKDYKDYAKSDAAKELLASIGLKNMIIGVFKAIPGAIRIYLNSRKLAKKWDIWNFENRMDEKLVDLRKEHNVKLLGA